MSGQATESFETAHAGVRAEDSALPPHSVEAERGVLGCCLLAPTEAVPWAMEQLSATGEEFYDLRHRTLWRVLAAMFAAQQGIDVLTVAQRLKDLHQLEEIGGLASLGEWQDAVPSAAHMGYYLEIVREKAVLRRVVAVCAEIAARGMTWSGEPAALVSEAQARVLGVTAQEARARQVSMKDGVVAAVDRFERIFEHRNQGTMTGHPTGLSFLDKRIGGLHAGQVCYIAAAQSMGKTSLMLTLAHHQAVVAQIPVGIVSIESSAEELIDRLGCMASGATYGQLHSGHLSQSDLHKLMMALPKIAKAPLVVHDENAIEPEALKLAAWRLVSQHGARVIYIDHLHRIRCRAARGDRYLTLLHAVDAVRWIARQLGVAVVCMAQVNREKKRELKKQAFQADASDVRGTSEIEEDADVMGILQQDPQADGDCNPEAEVWPMNLQIVKQRNGPQGPVLLTFRRKCFAFSDRYGGTGSVAKGERKAAEAEIEPVAISRELELPEEEGR